MADCLMDLVLRRGETDLAQVQAQLTLVAPVPTLVGATSRVRSAASRSRPRWCVPSPVHSG